MFQPDYVLIWGRKKYVIKKHDPGLWAGLDKVEVAGLKLKKYVNSVQQKYLCVKYVSIYCEKVDHIEAVNNILFPTPTRCLETMIRLGKIVPHFNYRLAIEEMSSADMCNGHWMQILIIDCEQEEAAEALWQ